MASLFVFILRRPFSPQGQIYTRYTFLILPSSVSSFLTSNGLNLTDNIFSSWHTIITGPCRALVFLFSFFPFILHPQCHFSLRPHTSILMHPVYVLHFKKKHPPFFLHLELRDLKIKKKKNLPSFLTIFLCSFELPSLPNVRYQAF